MRESSQDKQVLPILPSVWTISTPFPNGQYEQFAKVSFNLVFGHRLWCKLCFLCLINVQMCLTWVYFFKEKFKMGRIFKGWILPASNLHGQNHARRALARYGLWSHYLKFHVPQKVSGSDQEQWELRGYYWGLSRHIKHRRNGKGTAENNKKEGKVYMGTEETIRRSEEKIWLIEMSMLEMEGRKKVYCKLTFFPLSREEKVNYVFPTSNFQIYSHSFPSILAVFLGLRVGHFCSDFRSFYCTVSSTVKIIREHAVTWHSELPAWFYLLSLGFCVFF